jgi:hypothetical protein
MPLEDFAAPKVAPNKHLSLDNAEPKELAIALRRICGLGGDCLALEIARLAGLYKYYNLVQRGSGASAPLTTIRECLDLILTAANQISAKLATSGHDELRGSVEAIRAEMSKQRDFSSSTIATKHFLHKETALLFVGAMDQAYLIFKQEIKAARKISNVALCMDVLELDTDRLIDNGKDLISESCAVSGLLCLGPSNTGVLDAMSLGFMCKRGGVVVKNGGRSRGDTPDLECREVIAEGHQAKRSRLSCFPTSAVQAPTVRTPTPSGMKK